VSRRSHSSSERNIVNKLSLAATSLVAAVPAALLLFLLIMSLISNPGFENMAGFLRIVAIAAVLTSAAVVLMPAGIMVFGGPRADSDEAAAEGDTATDEPSAAESDILDEETAATGDSGSGEIVEEEFIEEEEVAESSEEDLFEAGEDEDFDIEGFDDKPARR
jgi:hypothetical protein